MRADGEIGLVVDGRIPAARVLLSVHAFPGHLRRLDGSYRRVRTALGH